jgi:hypothetical protein
MRIQRVITFLRRKPYWEPVLEPHDEDVMDPIRDEHYQRVATTEILSWP